MAFDKRLNKAERRHIVNARKEANGNNLRESEKFLTKTKHHSRAAVKVWDDELVDAQ